MLKLEMNSPDRPIVYVLVSIMSSQYHIPDVVKQMMLETYQAYGDVGIPIIYVCGDTVYNITKPFLFKNTERDPVERGRTKWLETYKKAFQELEASDLKLNHEILYWDTIKNSPEYFNIRKFTDVIFNRDLTLATLQETFSDIEVHTLEDLIQDIKSKKILENVPVIADEFRSKNLTRIGKKVKREEKDIVKLRTQLAKAGIVGSSQTQVNDYDASWHTLRNDLLLATHVYLSEEFSIFLLLSVMKHGPDIKAKFNLESHALQDSTLLKPILSYPISSTKGSDTIFSTFRAVEFLYVKYCHLLGLPTIEQPVTLVDPFRPGVPYPQYESALSCNIEHREAAASDTEALQFNSHTLDPITNQKSTGVSTTYSTSQSLPFFALPERQMELTENQTQLEDDTSKITSEIIEKINQHLESKEDQEPVTTRTLYKNGIICEITSSGRLSDNEQIMSLSKIPNLIKFAVLNVNQKNNDEEAVLFHYKGYHFELVVKSTAPRPSLIQTVTATMGK